MYGSAEGELVGGFERGAADAADDGRAVAADEGVVDGAGADGAPEADGLRRRSGSRRRFGHRTIVVDGRLVCHEGEFPADSTKPFTPECAESAESLGKKAGGFWGCGR